MINPAGSPTSLASLGFAIFNDTLQYGGSLPAGYQARYLFHVDGINSGTGALADLSVEVDGNPGDSFFASSTGNFTADWVTRDYAINGVTPQTIHVQFSNQVVFDVFNLMDGGNYSGTSDFSATLVLSGIEVVDGMGATVTGWTLSSASGTPYNLIGGTFIPEAGGVAMWVGLGVVLSAGFIRCRRNR